ncbi:ATP-binding protein [Modestobacter sp. VKM Ac-2983]|uniref:ATP-binding protein n=1 Tax=Modestobacter sp. VKM Ac-2983 TaxID=3004137 RepID=UPI0022ABBBCD|nr:ATP-binding protein [Modestobacter sp. VKM Ac-2983]MCZ2805245.1 ATP-binding protein [Modestobacter sp. VKM Ac-2983]
MVDTTGAATGERRTERLELRVPTSPTQLPAVRAMTGDLAMRMDFDLDAVEDLRLAVDEACATLSSVALGGAPLTVVFEAARDGLRIDAWVPTAPGVDVPRDGFGWAVLHTLVDTVEAGPSNQSVVPAGNGQATPVACISLVKKLRRYSTIDALSEQSDPDVSVAR